MSIKHLYPTSTPALNLNPKSSRVVDPRISCTRSTTGTYVDPVSRLVKTAAVNEARVDKNGLMVEESRTNECKYSEDITTRSQAWGVNEATVTTNATTAPDGTTTADALFETTASGDHRLQYYIQIFTKISTSVFVKPNGRDYVSARIFSGANHWSTVVFELTGDGTITKIEDGSGNIINHLDSSIEAVANGWYRISITTNRTSSNYQYPILLGTCTTANPTLDATLGAELFAGDNTKGIYVWGAQFEYEKDFLTSYIPTSGSTVTRNADEVSFLNNNLTSWYNNSQGTFLIDINALGSNGDYVRLMQTNQQHRFEYSQLSSSGGKAIHFSWLSGGTSRTPQGTAPLGEFKIAANYSIGNVSSICIDGAETLRSSGNTAGTAAHTAPTELRLCRQSGNSQYLSSYVKRLVFYQAPIANTALEALTQ